ncbi:thiamine biosynthesis protein ThiS [Marinitoga sp. 1197]|uniref:sulfur carrier protein ThiS n=1 Tax=Marinitoga sp. 1197 TaxID=1428449 RepID=UPI000640BDC1|nr:sulfur carrier protein ThiS [Marinitoga sp. 1197]KLO22776.1 thiamine biosynthesis protein ThiS [Marinitoga sp. 1197]
MRVYINGKEKECKSSTLKELLEELSLSNKPVVVIKNSEIISIKNYIEHRLSKNDKIEIITVVGGG